MLSTVIEALDAAKESYRAELVYQSGLRAGLYSHWKKGNEGKSIDLHRFPVAVAKACVFEYDTFFPLNYVIKITLFSWRYFMYWEK
jgi:hypothetical protein